MLQTTNERIDWLCTAIRFYQTMYQDSYYSDDYESRSLARSVLVMLLSEEEEF